ncbi:hypothetical protein [Salinicoccus roseus]|uniref:hypothetical protein n=1 Tax=Salinicoccus roseus TaxID=45670 RepID=UPI002301F5AC|nr:hypothetical protein [Salinicoccus roseus]
MNLKLFIFTVDEYLRFRKVFVKNEIENSVEDNYGVASGKCGFTTLRKSAFS